MNITDAWGILSSLIGLVFVVLILAGLAVLGVAVFKLAFKNAAAQITASKIAPGTDLYFRDSQPPKFGCRVLEVQKARRFPSGKTCAALRVMFAPGDETWMPIEVVCQLYVVKG